MDLSYIQELLDSFSTFTGAIGDFLQLPAQIISDVLEFLGVVESEESVSGSSALDQTSSILDLGSSEADSGAGEGGDADSDAGE